MLKVFTQTFFLCLCTESERIYVTRGKKDEKENRGKMYFQKFLLVRQTRLVQFSCDLIY